MSQTRIWKSHPAAEFEQVLEAYKAGFVMVGCVKCYQPESQPRRRQQLDEELPRPQLRRLPGGECLWTRQRRPGAVDCFPGELYQELAGPEVLDADGVTSRSQIEAA